MQYAHARLASLQRNAADVGLTVGTEYALLTHPREGDLIRTIGEFPEVVASAAELREPHRVARYLETLASAYHKFYDACRVLPMGDEEITELHRARLALCAAARQVLANGLELLGVICSGADVTRAHPAGPLHAGIHAPPETAGPRPGDAAGLDELAPSVWPRNAARGADGAMRVAGVDVRAPPRAAYCSKLARLDGDPDPGRQNPRPAAVIATVCSKCAASDPSSVEIDQPSSWTYTSGEPDRDHRLDRDRHPLGEPLAPPGRPKFGTCGASW